MFVGKVCCDAFSGSLLDIQYLYHTNLVSNDHVNSTRQCVLYITLFYCYYNHFSLVVGMVVMCLLKAKINKEPI